MHNALLGKALPYALLTVALLITKCTYDGRRRAEGALGLQLHTADSTIRALRVTMRQSDQQFTRDTTALRTELARWQAIKQRVRVVVRDSLLPPDTVEGPGRVQHDTVRLTADDVIRQADAAISACTTAVSTCEVRVAQRDSTIKQVTFERDAYRRKSSPSLLTRISTATKWVAVGFLIGALK